MSEYTVTVPKGTLSNYNGKQSTSQHQDSGALHAQEYTHMNDSAFLLDRLMHQTYGSLCLPLYAAINGYLELT